MSNPNYRDSIAIRFSEKKVIIDHVSQLKGIFRVQLSER